MEQPSSRRTQIKHIALALALAVPITLTMATTSARAVGADCDPSAAAPTTRDNPVTDWNEKAQMAIVPVLPPGTPLPRPPGSSAVLEGILQVAIYDATVAIEGGYEPFIASPAVIRPASTAAAVAKAACEVLIVRVPDQATNVAEQFDAYIAAIPDGPARDNGISVGAEVAQTILAWRADDGFDNSVPWVQPTTGPGVFEPFPPGTTPVDVKLQQVRPLTLTSNQQFRPDGPNPLTSAEYASDFNEVKTYGRVDSAVRTPEQTQTALFWAENSAVMWPRNLRRLALDQGLDLADSARMLAMTQVAAADAILACFDAKYHYLSWRPVHAIRRADTDGNPLTTADPTWSPMLVVNHPEYPSAHGCWTTAVTTSLAAFFGTNRIPFSMDSLLPGGGPVRSYGSFKEAAKEVYDARTWAGLHFRNSTMEGASIGRKVARYVAEDFFGT